MIRVYTALLTASQSLFNSFGKLADPYMTLVGYFNSLRELGGTRRLAEDDVQTRSYRVALDSKIYRPGLAQRKVRNVDELTSRVGSKDIPNKLSRLEKTFSIEARDADKYQEALDVVLATNMLSVGVDVPRLGLMAVNGQPKNTAEYIQATSRVGRRYPGLVVTMFAWARPRDYSHYEAFEHYHKTFYKFVEAQSVTPFASRALDRGLTGAMVSLLRGLDSELNPNSGAKCVGDAEKRKEAFQTSQTISRRAGFIVNSLQQQFADDMIQSRLDYWNKKANAKGIELAYEEERKHGTMINLLKRPSPKPWDDFTVALSMREVEPEITLILDGKKSMSGDLNSDPDWDHQPASKDKKGDGKE